MKMPAAIDGIHELTPLQQGLLFHSLYAPESAVHNLCIELSLDGQIDDDAFDRAWAAILERHPVLRTSFVWERVEKPYQVVRRDVNLTIDRQDWRTLDESEQGRRRADYLDTDARLRFDLTKAPLFRVTLCRTGDRSYRLIWTFHHILLEGWSAAIVLKELWAVYAALLAGATPRLPTTRSYADYLGWLQTRDDRAAERYWREALKGFDRPTRLPIDRSRGETPAAVTRVQTCSAVLTPPVAAALDRLTRSGRITPSTIVQGAWALLLRCYDGADDVIFGTVVAGRPPELPGSENIVGLFVNTLPTRIRVPGEAPLASWLQQLQLDQAAMRAFEHTALMRVQGWSAIPGGQPMFHSVVAFQNWLGSLPAGDAAPGVRVTGSESRSTSDQPLTLFARWGDTPSFTLAYDVERFDDLDVRRLLERFVTLLERMAGNPEGRVADLSLLPADEREQLDAWNATERAYHGETRLHRLVEEQVARTPDEIAVVFADETLTYAALDARSNQLARVLRAHGVGPDVLVGVCAERSLELVVALLAVLKAGGAYVPLDPAYPSERLAQMLEDAQAPVVLVQRHLHDVVRGGSARVLPLEAATGHQAGEPLGDVGSPDDLAYVIFTSGSTGRPKGAMNAHRGIVNRLQWMQQTYVLKPADRVLQKTPYSFDVSVWEFFWPLLSGARIVVARPDGHKDPAYLCGLIQREGITTLHFVPSMLRTFLDEPGVERCTSLVRIICSGEALPAELQARVFATFPEVELHNLYGPTECAVDVSYWACRRDDARASVPIGRPVANTQLHILDDSMQRVPIGVPGELYIGGVQVGRGYVNRPDLTAQRFVPDPFAGSPLSRLYKTGDRARWLADGTIDYLGRLDFQVKIRGQRIELGEIEAVLDQHPGVSQSVVVVREDSPGDQRLVAYVVPGAEPPTAAALRAHLAIQLPAYMVPGAFVNLAALPLTASGKTDRKALPAPERGSGAGAVYSAPRTSTETLLADVWAQVLRLDRVGVEDNFFELGGHSLLAMQVVSRVRQTLGLEVPLRALFEAPTVAALGRYLDRTTTAGVEMPPLEAGDDAGPAVLSYAQQRLWLLDRLEPGSVAYNLAGAVELKGALDVAALETALTTLVGRHEALRTTFVAIDGEPRQVIAPAGPCPLPITAVADRAELETCLRQEIARPFDLERGPLFRAALYRVAADVHVLSLALHHIVADGWSLGILIGELGTAYRAAAAGAAPRLPALPITYKDVARWQRTWLEGAPLEQQLGYWTGRLAGAPQVLEIPSDRPRPAVESHRGAVHAFAVDRDLTARLHALSRREGATLFMTLLAGFSSLLSRYTGQNDLLVGTPVANRTRPEFEGLVGVFINTLVMRADLSGAPTVRELIGRIRTTALDAFAHQDLPFERLVAALQPVRDLGRSPVVQVMFVLQNGPGGALEMPGLTFAPVDLYAGAAKVDLTLQVEQRDDELHAVIEYAADLFDAASVARFADQWRALLGAMVAAPPSLPVADLSVLAEHETRALVAQANGAIAELSAAALPQLLRAQAVRTPSATAATCGHETITYAALQARATALAAHLQAHGAGPGVFVGVCVHRSLDMLIAVLGVLESGAAYLPLDPDFPADRLAFMLADSGAPLLICHADLAGRVPGFAGTIVRLDTDAATIAGAGAPDPTRVALPDDPAYIIYTSGSTGTPKGVVVPHRAVVNFLQSMAVAPGLEATDVLVAVTTLSFDIAGLELFLPLTVGAQVVIASREVAAEGARLAQLLDASKATVMQATPVTWRLLRDAGWTGRPGFRALCGGEALPRDLADSMLAGGVELWNMYGPTETTIWSTVHQVTTGSEAVVPIGRPIANTQVYVLDAAQRLTPLGVPGELYIGGAGVASGYWHRPELTDERFVADPFGRPGARLYRTGDAARWGADGVLEYRGRLDTQVKLRGYRIELGEIEAQLQRQPGVAQSAVVVREDRPGDRWLVAYVVATPGATSDPAALREALKGTLPEYMVPGAFVILDALPLTPNGKVDRKALPAPDRTVFAASHSAPRDDYEIPLVAIFERVLGVAGVGIDDSFFDLGGHSLLAVRLITQIESTFGRNLPLATLFEAPTVAQLAAVLRHRGWTPPWNPLVALQPHGTKLPFFCIHSLGANLVSYRKLATLVGTEQPFYGLQPCGLDGNAEPHDSVEAMAAHYISEIRTVQPHGPYRLGGVCLGGIVAFEMAQQLRAQGEEVALVAMIDSYFPGVPPHQRPDVQRRWGLTAVADYYLGDVLLRSPLERVEYVATRIVNIGGRIRRAVLSLAGRPVRVEGTLPRVLARIHTAHSAAERNYVPVRYPGRVQLFWCSELPVRAYADTRLGWSDFADGGLDVVVIPGNHMSMVEAPHVNVLAAKLRTALDRTVTASSTEGSAP